MPDLESILSRTVLDRFSDLFGRCPAVCGVAPGRLNLIGEHTDYNDGYVLPVAIDKQTTAFLSKRDDDMFVCHSLLKGETVKVRVEHLAGHKGKGWFSYVAGVASLLMQEGIPIDGVDCLLTSTIPEGAGLSSSAALEVSMALGLLALAERSLPAEQTIRLCQQAEHEWAGVPCGIMDQFISVRGSSNAALLIDCRSTSFQAIPVSPSLNFIVCNTNVPHTLAASEYAKRVQECSEAVDTLRTFDPNIASLRDVTLSLLQDHRSDLDPTAWKRAHHVVRENQRVTQAADALWYADQQTLGALMNESHESLRDDYQVSCDELDLMARISRSVEGVHGARMVGAGFGGSVLAIASTDILNAVHTKVQSEYAAATGLEPTVLSCQIGEGARAIHIC